MIQLQHVSIRRGSRLLFKNATAQLHPGWKIGLTGGNGAGKSSFFAALMGMLSPDAGTLSRPNSWVVAHMAQEVEALDEAALRFVLSGDAEWITLQDALQDPATPDEQLAKLYQRFDEIDGYTAEARAAQLLNGLGFSESQHTQPVSSFSGGWRMRLNLAKTLMCRSDLLLLDEPTNHLDLDAIIWLEDWLNAYRGTLLMISHDRDFLDAITDHILHIENGAMTLYNGNYSQFARTRAERLAQEQQAFEKQEATRAHLQKFIDRFKAKASKAKQAQSRIKQLERLQDLMPAQVDSPFSFTFKPPSRMSSPLIELKQASIGYPNHSPLLQSVQLQLTPDSRIALLGMNGAGKSTLIKALIGELTLQQGERLTSQHLNLGYFAQHQMDALDDGASPMLALKRIAPKTHEADLRAFLGGFGFSGERMDTPCGTFSGGERARLALALIVWHAPNVLVLDEPTNHLDLEMRSSLSFALQSYEGAVVLVSHERSLIASVCDEFYLVHQGSCVPFDDDLNAYATWLRQTRQTLKQQDKKQDKKQERSEDTKEEKEHKEKMQPEAAPNVVPTSAAVEMPELTYAQRQAQKKQDAEKRQQTQPLRKKISQLEQQLDTLNTSLANIAEQLNDSVLYSDTYKPQLLALLNEQTRLKAQLETAETTLLEHMEELEQLS